MTHLPDLAEIRPDLKPDPNKQEVFKAQLPIFSQGRFLGLADSWELVDASKTEIQKSAEPADNSVFDSLFDFPQEPEDVQKSADSNVSEADRELMTIWPNWLRS